MAKGWSFPHVPLDSLHCLSSARVGRRILADDSYDTLVWGRVKTRVLALGASLEQLLALPPCSSITTRTTAPGRKAYFALAMERRLWGGLSYIPRSPLADRGERARPCRPNRPPSPLLESLGPQIPITTALSPPHLGGPRFPVSEAFRRRPLRPSSTCLPRPAPSRLRPSGERKKRPFLDSAAMRQIDPTASSHVPNIKTFGTAVFARKSATFERASKTARASKRKNPRPTRPREFLLELMRLARVE